MILVLPIVVRNHMQALHIDKGKEGDTFPSPLPCANCAVLLTGASAFLKHAVGWFDQLSLL